MTDKQDECTVMTYGTTGTGTYRTIVPYNKVLVHLQVYCDAISFQPYTLWRPFNASTKIPLY